MTLPDQTTAEALKRVVSDYEAKAKTLVIPFVPAGPALVSVEGGRLAQSGEDSSGRYYRVVGQSITGEAQVEGFRPRFPVVDVFFRWQGFATRGLYHVGTSPAFLLAVDGTSIPDALLHDATTTHTFRVGDGGPTRELRLQFAMPGQLLAIGPVALGDPPRPQALRYRVPATATMICGDGELVYTTGHREAVLPQGAQFIGRPVADGGLGLRAGEVFAEFRGLEPAFVRVGNTWIQTPAL